MKIFKKVKKGIIFTLCSILLLSSTPSIPVRATQSGQPTSPDGGTVESGGGKTEQAGTATYSPEYLESLNIDSGVIDTFLKGDPNTETWTEVKKIVDSAISEQSRKYGVNVYLATVGAGPDTTTEQIAEAIEGLLREPNNSSTPVSNCLTSIWLGGKDGGEINGPYKDRSLWYKITSLDGQNPELFFEILLEVGIPQDICEKYQQALATYHNKKGNVDLPVLLCYPAVLSNGTMHDLYKLGSAHLAVCSQGEKETFAQQIAALFLAQTGSEVGKSVIDGAGGGATKGTVIIGSNSNHTSNYIFGDVSTPLKAPITTEKQGTFYVSADPKLSYNNWAEQATVTGVYTLYKYIPDDIVGVSDDGYIDIEIKANFEDMTLGKAKNAELQAANVSVKLSNEESWNSLLNKDGNSKMEIVQGKTSTISCTIPVSHIPKFNTTNIIYTATIEGGTVSEEEQCRPASFTVTADGKALNPEGQVEGFSANGDKGLNYTSWISGKPEELDDTPYDKHTIKIPTSESKVVANSADPAERQWDADIGIPSTENVAIRTGAESCMIDAYGWMCVRPMDGNIKVGVSGMGMTVDDNGHYLSGQAATRTITLKAQVTDCWGSDNPVCQLSPWSDGASGGESNTTHTVVMQGTAADQCGAGHPSSMTYTDVDANHTIPAYSCGQHQAGWTGINDIHSHSLGGSCSYITGYEPDIPDDPSTPANEFKQGAPILCGGTNSCTKGSANAPNHNCQWSWYVKDAVPGDDWLGETSSIPDVGYIVLESFKGSTTVKEGVPAAKGKLCDLTTSEHTGVKIRLELSWRALTSRQAYNIIYTVSAVEDILTGQDSSCAAGLTNDKGQADFRYKSGKHNNIGDVFCSGYTHGTGSIKKCYENIAHEGTHNYTITYTEYVDTYAYRTIENAAIYPLTHISLDKVHTISTTSGKDINGETWEAYSNAKAPLNVGDKERKVSAPDSVGYLWRCLGESHGEYISGNGRILWEAWVNSLAKPDGSGNVAIELDNAEYYKGDVTVTMKITQDSFWGNSITEENTWEPKVSEAGIMGRGHAEEHIHDHYNSTHKYIATSNNKDYLTNTDGDTTKKSPDKEAEKNDNSAHSEVVCKEIKCVLNYWSGINSGLAGGGEQLLYKANIISDTLIYGGNTTNIFLEDAYSVDGNQDIYGVPLFNMHATPTKCITTTGSNTAGQTIKAYRSHVSDTGLYGADVLTMKEKLKADIMSKATVVDRGSVGLFGGVENNSTGGIADLNEAMVYKMWAGMGPGTFGLNCSPTKGETVRYSGELEPPDNHKGGTNSGFTTITLKNKGSSSESSFSGYWGDIEYPAIGSSTATIKVNNTIVNTVNDGITDNGQTCIQEYGTLAMSNIPLTSWTPNDVWHTGQVGAYYQRVNVVAGTVPSNDEYKPDEQIQKDHEECAKGGALTSYLNQITIYNPMSAENDWVIGAQAGAFEPGIPNDTDHDQRITGTGEFLRDTENYSITTKPYVVQSQFLWSWLSPFGNFASVGGSKSSDTADMSITGNGAIKKGEKNVALYNGYVNNMQINQWAHSAGISYPFIAGDYTGTIYTTDVHVELSVNDMLQAHSGSHGKQAGSASSSNLKPPKFYWGNAFAATNTSNVTESDMDNDSLPKTEVRFTNYGINPYLKTGDSELSGTAKFGYLFSKDSNADSKTANAVYKYDPVNLVGSIGNVTIHDVEDFRYSNYFKEPTSNWLIEGVIKEVDVNKPLRVVSSPKDICFNEVNYYVQNGEIRNRDTHAKVTDINSRGHATLGVTIFTRNMSYGGMAGYYDPLPLVPRYNNIPEYKTEPVRLGYKSYISVDTIGQYQSYLDKDEKTPDGPGDTDTREHYLDVTSEYYLYDLDNGKLYDIDIWSGSTGGKERIYNGTTKKAEQITQAGTIFQEVRAENNRRNIGLLERSLSKAISDETDDGVGGSSDWNEPTYYYSASHYIGRPGSIRLDNRDLSYIGSGANFSEGRFWSESALEAFDLNKNSQRYHFKDGLTSTSLVTKPLGDNPTQAEIMDANKEVQEEHPHSVVIQFMNFTARGEVWTIKHNGSAVMDDSFTIFDTSEDGKYIPKDWDKTKVMDHNTVNYKGAITYNPKTGNKSGSINKDSTPVVVYQAFNTSADDRTISGTH